MIIDCNNCIHKHVSLEKCCHPHNVEYEYLHFLHRTIKIRSYDHTIEEKNGKKKCQDFDPKFFVLMKHLIYQLLKIFK